MITLLSTIISLAIVEVLLSIDNALVNATLAEALPEQKRKKAIRVGIILGAVFRLVVLLFATIIIENAWIKAAGGMYLIYLALTHLDSEDADTTHSMVAKTTMTGVIVQIAIADMVFSIDNVISAVSFSSNTILVIFGVLAGIVGMLVITPLLSKLIHKYPRFASSAYIIVGLIGFILLLETWTHIHIAEAFKFLAILGILWLTYLVEKHEHWERRLLPPLRTILKKLSIKKIKKYIQRKG